MRPTWVIEANVEGLPSEALQAEIHRQGMTVHVIKPFLQAKPPRDVLGAESIPFDASVVFTGTLTLLRYIRENRRWVPGGWCNFDNLACSKYYTYFGPHLLNRNYTVLPIAEAIRLQEHLGRAFAIGANVFVRPDSVDKSFSGKLVNIDSLDQFLAAKAFDPTTLILIAEPREIGREWRLFVAHSEVVTGSQYLMSGQTKLAAGIPSEVSQFASKVLREVTWRPDPLFVMDIGETKSGLHVVELNSFSCSGLCSCDLEAYVGTASRFAELSW